MLEKPEGSRPAVPDHRPVFRPGTACEKQQLPDLNAVEGPAEQIAHPNPVVTATDKVRMAAADADLSSFMKRMQLIDKGTAAPDPLAKFHDQWSALGRREANKLLKVPMETLAKRSGKLYGNGDGKDGAK
jgi:hypothetical protein